MPIRTLGKVGAALTLATLASHSLAAGTCTPLYKKGVLELDFNPAFIHISDYDSPGGKTPGLAVSSFYNIFKDPETGAVAGSFAPDQVNIIRDLNAVDYAGLEAARVERITDLDWPGMGPTRTVWPNDADRVPDGVLPFEAVVIPQGFHTTPYPGRLSIINLDSPIRQEYLVAQSTQGENGMTFPGDPANSPRFYHKALFIDMDGDGLKDIVSSRSGFKVRPSFYPPFSELVWFKNPGLALQPDQPWEETVLFGGPNAGFLGPDINLDAADMNNDGIPEIVASHFFSSENAQQGEGRIVIYGAPEGGDWSDVNAATGNLPRVHTISDDQGLPFGVEIIDLNNDGRLDVLATNHQTDNCTAATTTAVPGRVYALEMPRNGELFSSQWKTHILKDNIRPNPSTTPVSPPGRLAPGHAHAFHTVKFLEGATKPSIVVGGDEASKVWVLAPKKPHKKNNWQYHSAVVFDINRTYGRNTSQTFMDDPSGVTISTIGTVGVGYTNSGPFGVAELYIPVFEAKDIHVLSYSPMNEIGAGTRELVGCRRDRVIACPVED